MLKPHLILGFSGGIDSAAAAQRLSAEGYDVTALTLDMTGDSTAVEQARRRAAGLGLRHEVVDIRAGFRREVEDYFTDAYLAGHTPAPCTRCNERIKWPQLIAHADATGAHYVATGHYFRIEYHNGHPYVARAADQAKDQSYYLWGVPPATLRRVVTPMGDVIKKELAPAKDAPRESMGVCFLGGGGYRDLLESRFGPLVPGEVVDTQGRVISRHDGAACYTIGQKRGLGLPDGMAVVATDIARNRLVAGPDALLWHHTLELEQCRVTDERELLEATDLRVVIRGVGRNPQGTARITRTPTGYRAELEEPAWAPAAGQPAVFYRGGRVLGGGIVVRYY